MHFVTSMYAGNRVTDCVYAIFFNYRIDIILFILYNSIYIYNTHMCIYKYICIQNVIAYNKPN